MLGLLRHKWWIIGIAALVGVTLYYWNFVREPDWRQSAIDDVAFMRQVIQSDHPGGADTENPEFLATLEAAHARAMGLAERVDSPAGYFYATRAMTMPFQDVHLAPQFYRALPRSRQWPGFFVALDAQGVVSVARSDRPGAPPVGARLMSCDGKPAETLYRDRIAPFQFRSWLPALQPGDWPWILIDSGNPFLDNPESCDFETSEGIETFRLGWEQLDTDTLAEFEAKIEPDTDQTTELRIEAGKLAWISVASFFDSGDSVSEELAALIDSIDAQRDSIEDAEALVIDVRGNLGGASAAGYAVAEALWGEDFIADRIPRYTSTDWRASDNNLDRINSALLPLRVKFGSDSELFGQVTAIRDGIQRANAAGEPFFVQPQSMPPATGAAPRDLPDRIYFLTDHDCVSACLDFADLMDAIEGVVHIGTETSGDTLYLEVATADLPSGLGQLVYPTAIHRGRVRGVNESHRPDVIFPGDISATSAIAAWILDGTPADESI